MHTWGKSDGPVSLRLSFVLRTLALIIPVSAVLLALKPPEALSGPPLVHARSAESFQTKVAQLQQSQGEPVAEVRLTGDEVTAGLAQSANASTTSDPEVEFEGDVVKGRFAAKVAGEHVYVTVAGHLGAKDGYVTFQPTQFMIGQLSVPVSLVNGALQSKMREAGDQLKLPDYVADLRVENGALVIKTK